MPGQKREAQEELPKPVKESDMDLEFEDPWDDEFSDASVEYEQVQDEEDDSKLMDDDEDHKGNYTLFNA